MDNGVRCEGVLDQRTAESLAMAGGIDEEGVEFVAVRAEESDGHILGVDGDPKVGRGEVLFKHDRGDGGEVFRSEEVVRCPDRGRPDAVQPENISIPGSADREHSRMIARRGAFQLDGQIGKGEPAGAPLCSLINAADYLACDLLTLYCEVELWHALQPSPS